MITTLCALALVSSPVTEVRGWMFHGSRPYYHQLVLRKAKEYGINHLEISGDNPTTSDEMAGSAGDLVESTARAAREQGIDAYIWVRELNTRDKSVSMDPSTAQGKEFWDRRQNLLKGVFERAPDLSGIVLSYASTPYEIWEVSDKSAFWQEKSMEERIRFVTKQFTDVTRQYRKRVYIRDFNHSPQQLRWLMAGLRDGEGYTMHSKWVPQDWQLFYPQSLSIGAYGKTPQVIEADLGAEYWGRSMVPVSLVRYIKMRWDYDRTHGCKGIVARVDRDDETAFGTPSEINIYALSRYLTDPKTTPDQVYDGWNAKAYGLKVGSRESRTLTRIYERTFDYARRMYYTLGFWTPKDQTEIPESVASIQGTIVGKSTALWNASARTTQERLVHPDAQVRAEILADRKQAVVIAEQNLSDFAAVRPAMPTRLGNDWQSRLELAVSFAKVWEAMADAVWSLRVAEETAGAEVDELRIKNAAFERSLSQLQSDGPSRMLRKKIAARGHLLSADIERRIQRLGSQVP